MSTGDTALLETVYDVEQHIQSLTENLDQLTVLLKSQVQIIGLLQHQCDRLRLLVSLSPAEREVYEALEKGFSREEIAGKLYKSPETIKKQMRSIRQKLGIESNTPLRTFIQNS